ncbi:ABC transporter permease [Rubripirellula sp.]|nr:ABC transporter permease [Rubripirellula sp.]MDB4621382.1 ABC transporter permease [Rubripirellula sp.]
MRSPPPAFDTISVHVIESQPGIQLPKFRELLAYKDLFMFLVWRQIKVRYAQSVLGIGWAVVQPLFSMVLFTIIFGNLAKMDSQGAPYALFSLAALLPWNYVSNSVTEGVASLVAEAETMKKVYFPRILIPLSATSAKLLDFAIACIMMATLMVIYQYPPPATLALLPLLVILMITTSAAVSIWLTCLAIQYRDIKYALNFLVQLAMYASPVVYSTSLIPEQYRLAYAINPLVGVIEGFRSAILGTQAFPWDMIFVSGISSFALLASGVIFFQTKEQLFTDVA